MDLFFAGILLMLAAIPIAFYTWFLSYLRPRLVPVTVVLAGALTTIGIGVFFFTGAVWYNLFLPMPLCVALLSALSLSIWHRADLPQRNMRRGCCPRCGYDLQHRFQGGCPECSWRRAAGRPTAVQIPTPDSRFAALVNQLRWWLMPTWIAPAFVYYLFMTIPPLAIVFKELERWPTSATVGLIVVSAFLLASSMVWLTLCGVHLRSRLTGALVLGALLLPANYLALWCFMIVGAIFGFHG